MRSLVRATFSTLMWLVAAGSAAVPAMADGDDAYSPAAVSTNGPRWERPKFTRFSAMRCSPGPAVIDKLTLNRDDASDMQGLATYTDAAKGRGYQTGGGGWALAGDQLRVSGDGFQLEGRWVGAFLTATIVRPDGGAPVRCRFQVTALRSFTQYQ